MNGKFWTSPRILSVRDLRTTSENPLFQWRTQAWPMWLADAGLILQRKDPFQRPRLVPGSIGIELVLLLIISRSSRDIDSTVVGPQRLRCDPVCGAWLQTFDCVTTDFSPLSA